MRKARRAAPDPRRFLPVTSTAVPLLAECSIKPVFLEKHPDQVIEYKRERWPLNGRAWSEQDIIEHLKRQVSELLEPRLEVTEHRVLYGIEGKVIHAELPVEVAARCSMDGRQGRTKLFYNSSKWGNPPLTELQAAIS